MVNAEIRGKQFPLCLTVGALDEIGATCGGLGKLSEYLHGDGSVVGVASRTTWALALLMREGQANRRATARICGEEIPEQYVPDAAVLADALTPGEACGYLGVVLEAVAQSLEQKIEAAPSKNAGGAGRV